MNDDKSFKYSYASPKREIKPSNPETAHNSLPHCRHALTGAVIWGIVSCLVFGAGLTCVLEWNATLPGFILGLTGIAGMAVAPAIYRRLSTRRQKYM